MAQHRRTVLLAAAGALLTGCGTRRSAARPPAPGPTRSAPAAPSPTPEASPTPSASTPTRDQIVARYRDARPTEWGTYVTGVTRRLPGAGETVALTFDACGGTYGSGYDHALISLLRRHRVPATLFLNARWIDANPRVAAELAGDTLFELANHGTSHRPLSVTGRAAYGITGTADPGEAYDEVAGNTARLHRLAGATSRLFRAGTAHYDEIATRIVADLGAYVAGFDVNADAGATYTPRQVAAAVGTASAGSIVLAHMNRPNGGTAEGFASALPVLLDSGLRCVRLSERLP
ncbi:MAG: polysaccharide deacetylase family protein [Micromonosporaceae bacterium]